MDYLLSQRKNLEQGLTTALRESDKLVVTISSAVLALSVGLVGQLREPFHSEFISFAWMSFLTSIGAVLLSLVIEQGERFVRISRIDKALKKGNENFRDVATLLAKLVLAINVAGIITFLCGLIYLALFLVANLA